ncbi:MAG TPA: YncE family protein [Bacteroidia bacterium]|jgi:DNA-binding beta-propeller fold protein YncE|nr:YncE family protein [Bacteroidia bacterium]
MKKQLFLAASLLLIASFTSLHAQSVLSPGHYKVADKIKLEGDGGWDYIAVDDNSNKLYVSHGTVVQVVDLSTNKLIATITGTNGVHGIAIASDLNKGFISDGKDSAVTIFDLTTNAIIAKINVTGKNPDAICYDKVTQRVFTFNGRSSNSTVIDAKTNTVIGTLTLTGKPEFAAADGTGKIFVNLEDKNMISKIDAKNMTVEATWPLAPGDGPSGLTMDTKTRRLFSVCDNKMMVVVNADDGKVVTTVPIGDGPDAVAFDYNKNLVYSSNGEGTLTVVEEKDANTFTVLENVSTAKRARTCTVNSKTHHIYLPTAEFEPAPEATKENPHPRPKVKPGTFYVLDVVPVE